ncbi:MULTISPECIES: choline/ethanolamine kinase family protein [Mycolicibacterium]|uniref:Aminoglycoside phosphotransferase n=1 Tax=Mycolicibacterium vanbaalenii (strain DSM 7251 / JCM 13017 / BCRC 16820 / KCTC 9966 / NRRL B-24157 / PYR-1) TaxID=350058 RepID=A1T7F3_MYCVP|nr:MULTISPECIES: choline/ethanolamine kinase family protein [Mycolicibacterium]ABM13103.1 aminoglycoside phosphotransferase [Mycolicibacterium vanbaalenii PYR-1]MCV7131008.1 phosphotransferase family protein [Mycolicibacterium vanbaalenii PYR-1]QZY48339.1 phosphotransferase family protein [Mycolicibacterium austroafricanum]UJL26859.1 phosphotransferase family protein [Mycolicibacterium vanbaalenii]WND58981.1 choline/ethanolamine kinase family protein [Mycolicibacterium vanbaalenii]
MSSRLTDEQLDTLFDQIGLLAGRPRTVQYLSGGLTNRNVKITTPDGVYVARCVDTGRNLLGIDRDREHYNSVAAERAGVGARVLDYRPDLGVLLLSYIDGKTLENSDFQREGVIAKVADACRTLHRGPRFRGRFDMFERQPAYLATVTEHGFRIPPDYLDHAHAFAAAARVLTATDDTTVPCNNDLLAGNFIEDGDRMWLIDYEYAGNNDPCFELGNIWSECGLSLDQLDELVTAYYGRPSRRKTARAHLQGIVAKYGWTLWGCIQYGSSAIEFDFWEWAMERYEAAVAEFRNPHFPRLLDAVAAED